MRLTKRLGAISLLCGLFVCIFASPVFAHAQLDSTSPPSNVTQARSPKLIGLKFSENVNITANSIRLFSATGERISTHRPYLTASNEIAMEIPKLDDGTYVVAWNVVSADSHPVRGAYTFTIGAQSSVSKTTSNATLEKVLNEQEVSTITTNSYSAIRFIVYVSLALVIALIIVRLFIARDDLGLALNKIFYVSNATLIVTTLLSILFQASIAELLPLSRTLQANVLLDALSTQFGKVALVRIVLALATFALFKWSRLESKLTKIALFVLATFLAITPAFAGHADAGKYVFVAIPFDAIHVFAASCWFGGLIALPFLMKKQEKVLLAQRFSKMALICAGAILLTGLFAWWRQVGSIDASFQTWFGKLISLKILLFFVTIGVAVLSRRQLNKLTTEPLKSIAISQIVRFVCLEILLLVAVMGTTSVVVNAVPGRTALSSPISKQVKADSVIFDVTIGSSKAGPVELHIFVLHKNGSLYQISDLPSSLKSPAVSATWTNKEKDIGPLPANIRFLGLNHFISTGDQIPFPGTWTLDVRLLKDQFNEESASVEIKFR